MNWVPWASACERRRQCQTTLLSLCWIQTAKCEISFALRVKKKKEKSKRKQKKNDMWRFYTHLNAKQFIEFNFRVGERFQFGFHISTLPKQKSLSLLCIGLFALLLFAFACVCALVKQNPNVVDRFFCAPSNFRSVRFGLRANEEPPSNTRALCARPPAVAHTHSSKQH